VVAACDDLFPADDNRRLGVFRRAAHTGTSSMPVKNGSKGLSTS